MQYAVEVNDVKKSYGACKAVRGVSFKVAEGTCFGILGPNGAGKTTLMEMMEGVTPFKDGSINILGMDINSQLKYIQPRMGVQLQKNSYFDFLSLGELLKFYVALRAASTKNKNNNPQMVEEILDMLSLADKINVKVDQLSGGQRQRFSIAVAMLEDPDIIFLDEPTSALDPQNRRHTWDFIERIKKDKNKTILLTTHYMEEAETLCDELIIMDHGKIISQGSPKELVRSLNKHQNIYIKYKNGDFPSGFVDSTVGVDGHTREEDSITVRSDRSIETIKSLLDYAEQNKIEITEFDSKLPNLEDVFISNTGAALRDE